ncbi:MAG TPA: LysM domain-containing protein, partial [Candidatus Wallbacteria bacterium]|nr:LysM domain-containing protein [Candidatus Wallbacteria bacterium]
MIKIFKNAIFIALILFFSVSAPSAAQEIGGKVYTIKEGETLLDIAKTDEVMVLAIKILNDLENPLELKTGSKIIIPDGSFVNEIIAMSATELEDR